MKRIGIMVGAIITLLFVALLFAPVLFKDKIRTLVIGEANRAINGELQLRDVGISFLTNFPNAKIAIYDYSLRGVGVFEYDTLIQGKELDLIVNMVSIFSEDAIEVKRVNLESPKIKAVVLQDGMANYDIIAIDSETEETSSSEESDVKIRLSSYEIHNGALVYDDATYPMIVSIDGLEHQGSGDFTALQYDFETKTQIESLSVIYEGISYLNHARGEADATFNVDVSEDLLVRLKKNVIKVNEFVVGGEGTIRFPNDEDIDIDIQYAAKENTFRSLLSIVPGMYNEYFEGIESKGNLVFQGTVSGTYNSQQYPGFTMDLQVPEASFQYPDLPTPITGIIIDTHIQAGEGKYGDLEIDLRSLHANFGTNPIDAKAHIRGMDKVELDGELNARLDLTELTQIFPIEDTELKGIFSLNAQSSGVYDEAQKSFPTVDAQISFIEGFIKNTEYPTTLSHMNVNAFLKNAGLDMASTSLNVSQFHFEMDGEEIDGDATIVNFENPSYKVHANGRLDLERLMHVYPIEGMVLSGKIDLEDFSTEGKYADIEAERYDKLPTRGKLEISDLSYSEISLPETVTIEQASLSFTPSRIDITQGEGKLGKSDYQVQGFLSNYLAYAFLDEALEGAMSYHGKLLDLNEWMIETGEIKEENPSESSTSVIPVPANVSILFDAHVEEVIYDNLNLKDFAGTLQIKDEQVIMDGLNFDLLGGHITMQGSYDTREIRQPLYGFIIDVSQITAKDAWQSFSPVQAFAPVARFLSGKINSHFSIQGRLKPNMMPVLEDMSSAGLFEVLEGNVEDFTILNKIQEATRIQNFVPISLKNIKGQFEIKDGFLEVKPFTLNHRDMQIKVSGKQNIAGKLDYTLEMDVPSGTLGEAAQNTISSLVGGNLPFDQDRLRFDLLIGGNIETPLISGLQPKVDVKTLAGEVIEKQLEDRLGTDTGLGEDSLSGKVQDVKEEVRDSLNVLAEQKKDELKDTLSTVKDNIEEKIGKKVEETMGEEAKNALDSLKKVISLPKFGKNKNKKN